MRSDSAEVMHLWMMMPDFLAPGSKDFLQHVSTQMINSWYFTALAMNQVLFCVLHIMTHLLILQGKCCCYSHQWWENWDWVTYLKSQFHKAVRAGTQMYVDCIQNLHFWPLHCATSSVMTLKQFYDSGSSWAHIRSLWDEIKIPHSSSDCPKPYLNVNGLLIIIYLYDRCNQDLICRPFFWMGWKKTCA